MSAMAMDDKFFKLLDTAHDEHQTGKLYAYARGNGVIHVATLLFKEGVLCGCKFDTQSGVDALKSIASAVIASVMFVRTSPGQIKEQAAIPEYGEVVQVLKGGVSADRSQAKEAVEELHGSELVYATAVTFGDVLGDKAMNKVEELGRMYPPDQNRQKFVSSCMDLASAFLGQKRAAEILDQLF